MEPVTQRKIKLLENEVAVVTPVKDERALLGHFLCHYRSLGVRNFFFIDNGSRDGSFEYLCAQPDCHVFSTKNSFRDANFGMDWVNKVIRTYLKERWVLFCDCDEFIVYEHSDILSLKEYCSLQASRGADCVYAAMIDMYPKTNFHNVKITQAGDPLAEMCYFDADYVFREWPRRLWDPKSYRFNIQVLGGPRIRLLSNLQKESRRGAYYYTLCNQIDRFVDFIPQSIMPTLAKVWPIEMPAQHKTPLNYVGDQFCYFNNHSSSNLNLASDFVGLMHYKLCDELNKKLNDASLLNDHYRRGLSYEQLRHAVSNLRDGSLYYEGSRKFSTWRDLARVGLIGDFVPRLWSDINSNVLRTPRAMS